MMHKKHFWSLLFALVFLCGMAMPAWADMGPKPSVDLLFEGLEGQEYAVTLLSPQKVSGPWNIEAQYSPKMGSEESWQALERYEDADGWNFLGYWSECTDTQHFCWDYYPPEQFKILVWLADTDTYVVSEPMERYAFDSYYTVRYEPETGLSLRRSYDYTWELISLACRVILTIVLEVSLAWLIGWRAKHDVRVILWTNVATQLGLNLALNLLHYYQGLLALLFAFGLLELLVFTVEGLVYQKMLCDVSSNGKKRHVWLYAFAANALSMVLGFYLMKWIPGIF